VDLTEPLNAEGQRLREVIAGLRIVEPAKFLLELKQWSDKKPRQ
jgi:hypothetical protein